MVGRISALGNWCAFCYTKTMKEFKTSTVAIKINDEVVEFATLTVGFVDKMNTIRRNSRNLQKQLAEKYGISVLEVENYADFTEEEQEQLQAQGLDILGLVFDLLVDKKQRKLVEMLNVAQLSELFEVLRG